MGVTNPVPNQSVTVTTPSTRPLLGDPAGAFEDEVRDYVRQSSQDDDDLLRDLVKAAKNYIESHTNRTLFKSTLRLALDDWPSGREIPLPRGPLYSTTALTVTYFKSDGSTAVTFPSSKYDVATDGLVPRVVLKNSKSWPSSVLRAAEAVRVTYEAGSTSVDYQAKQAARLLVGHWYENREGVLVGSVSKPIEIAVESLLSNLFIPVVP